MVDRADSREIAKRAKELYEARWRAELGSPVAPRQEAGQQDDVRLSFETIRRSRLISLPVAERQGYLCNETRPS